MVSMTRNSEAAPVELNGRPGWAPETTADREAVREQVGRILSSTLFRNSKRFPAFLRYTVDHALASPDPLKERTIGHQVFARDPGYDTGQDPVVRMTAAEVRKRLAQYYQQTEHQAELIVAFQPGSYVPEFFQPPAPPAGPEPVVKAPETGPPVEATRGWRTFPLSVMVPAALATLATVLLLIVLAAGRPNTIQDNAVARFWAPLVSSSSPVLICIGDPSRPRDQPEASAGQGSENPEDLTIPDFLRGNSVRYTDAVSVALISGELRSRGKDFRVRRPSATELKDLRDGPVVLVGGFNNPWTLKLSEGLRFTLASNADAPYIRDREHPENRQWQSESPRRLLRELKETYGLITRANDPATGHTVLTVSGLVLGTASAAECLLDADCLAAAEQLAAATPDQHNLQVVVSAPVIGVDTGAPRVVAAYAW